MFIRFINIKLLKRNVHVYKSKVYKGILHGKTPIKWKRYLQQK
jgi:hypothetical protein